MKLVYPSVFILYEDGIEGYAVEFPDLPGCVTGVVRQKNIHQVGQRQGNGYPGGARGSEGNQRGLTAVQKSGTEGQFRVTIYKAIKRNQCDIAAQIIKAYEPPFILAEHHGIY